MGDQRIPQIRQCVRHVEGITGAAIEFHEPFERLEPLGRARRKIMEHFCDDLVLAGIDHGKSGLGQNADGFFILPRLQQPFHDFLHRTIVFRVRLEDLHRQSDGLIPIRIFEMEIQKKFGLFSPLSRSETCSRSCAALVRLPWEIKERALTMTAAELFGSSFRALSASFSLSAWSPRASARWEAET